jgi:UDP-N-acetylmuramate--alanine ligase
MNLDLSKIKNVHFIGIGGIGISALARMMKAEGKVVTGQDMQEGEIVDLLRALDIPISIGQSFEKIPEDCDLIVYTIAIEYYDPELFKKIKEGKIPALSYPELLGKVTADKYTIAVSGTHGKTTTTAMIAKVLTDSGKDPSVVIGSLIKDSAFAKASAGQSEKAEKTNFVGGKSDYFVVEACEYRRSFLNVNPKILVITNIDADHLDYYKDIEDIKSAFYELASKVPEEGFIICDLSDENVSAILKNVSAKVINYKEFFNKDLKLKIPGIHNKKDAAAAVAVSACLGISKPEAERSLVEFSGTWRRFEYRGNLKNGTILYDDYGHHPTEIIATLDGFRELYPDKKITVVFQPHLFSRTKLLLNEFAKSFSQASEVLILPIYYAREEDDGTISSEILADRINENTHNAKAFPDFESTEKYLKAKLSEMGESDVIVTLGAGEAFQVGDFLLKL